MTKPINGDLRAPERYRFSDNKHAIVKKTPVWERRHKENV